MYKIGIIQKRREEGKCKNDLYKKTHKSISFGFKRSGETFVGT